MSIGLEDIVSWTEGRVVNLDSLSSRESIRVDKPSPLSEAQSTDISFFFSREYEQELPLANPGVLITAEPFVKPLEAAQLPLWKKSAIVACPDPYGAMALVSEKLAPFHSSVAHVEISQRTEIHPSAVIDPDANLGEGVQVGAGCVIEKGARIGAGTVLYPGCFIGREVRVGKGCVFFPRVSVYELADIENFVRLHAGVVVGSDGFGYAPIRNPQGTPPLLGHRKIYHLGRVRIGNSVEVGANACIDRGTFGDTVIEKNAKIDNLVQIGHNARVDEGAIICGGSALAGRAHVGAYAYVGGLTGIANHVKVGEGAKVGALALLTKDVPAGGTAVGNPQRTYSDHFKAHAALNRMALKKKRSKN